MTLDVGKGQVRVEAKLRSDDLKDVPDGCKSFVWKLRTLSEEFTLKVASC
jgi:hypothetical protein